MVIYIGLNIIMDIIRSMNWETLFFTDGNKSYVLCLMNQSLQPKLFQYQTFHREQKLKLCLLKVGLLDILVARKTKG